MLLEEIAQVRPPEVRPSPVSTRSQPDEYPLFGLRLWTGRLLKSSCVELAKRHLATSAPSRAPWKTLWANVLQHDDWFDTFWVVRLPRPSRSLPARAIVFHAQELSMQIPGAVRSSIREAWYEAEQAFPEARFSYLEPVYERTRTGKRRLLTPVRLAERIASQPRKLWYPAVLFGRVLRFRMHIEETLARWEEEVRVWRERRQAHREERMALRLALRLAAASLGLVRRDPIIAFERPAWLQPGDVKGTMPIALVAHWD